MKTRRTITLAIFAVIIAIAFLGCGGGKKTVTIKGNIEVTNNCSGPIVDTPLTVIVSYYDGAGNNDGTGTEAGHFKDGFYVFKHDSDVASAKYQITSVKGKSGANVCNNTVTCAAGKTCQETPGGQKQGRVPVGQLLTYDIRCDCK